MAIDQAPELRPFLIIITGCTPLYRHFEVLRLTVMALWHENLLCVLWWWLLVSVHMCDRACVWCCCCCRRVL